MTAATPTDDGSVRPHDWKNSTVKDAEQQLEHAIEAAKQRMCAAEDRQLKLQYWREMCRLIDRKLELSPPSTSARRAKASAECSGNAAGGGS